MNFLFRNKYNIGEVSHISESGMFFVIYEFEINLKDEQKFKDAWQELTLLIRNNYGGYGSRLHKDLSKQNVYVAYAKWPDHDSWKRIGEVADKSFVALRTRMKSFCIRIHTVYQLEMVQDLLLSDISSPISTP